MNLTVRIRPWLNTIERFGERRYGVFIILLVFFAVVFSPVLFGGQMFFNDDLWGSFYPYYAFYQRSLQINEGFLWNPNSSSGFPSFTGINNSLLSPITYIFSLLAQAPGNYHWTLFFYILLAAFFTDLFLKAIGMGFWGRLVGSLVYVCAQLFFDLDISSIAPIYALPLLFLCLWQIKEKDSPWRYVLLGGIGLGVSWLASYQGFLIQVLLVAGIWALVLSWHLRQNRKKALSIIGGYFLMVLIGAAISSFYIYWGFVYVGLSERAGGVSYAEAAVKALAPLDFGRFWLPRFKLNYLAIGQSTLYIGFLPLFLLVLSFFLRPRNRPIYYFSVFLYLGALAISIKYSPLFWLMNKLPILGLFRIPSRWMFVGSFGGALLVADALNRFSLSTEKTGEKAYFWFNRLSLAVLFLIAAVFTQLSIGYQFTFDILKKIFNAYLYSFTSQKIPLEHYYRIIETNLTGLKEVFDLRSAQVFWPVLFMVLGLLLLRFYYKRSIDNKLFAALAGILTIFNLFAALYPYHTTVSRKIVNAKSPAIEFLETHPGKILPFLSSRPHFEYVQIPQSIPVEDIARGELLKINSDLHLYFGLDGAGNSDSLLNRRMSRLLAVVGEGRFPGGAHLSDSSISPEEKIKLFKERKPILDWLGIRYIISAYDLSPQFKKVLETKNSPPYDYSISIYENENPRDLVYFAQNIQLMDLGEEMAFQKIFSAAKADFDILECRQNCPVAVDFGVAASDEVAVAEKKQDSIKIETKTSQQRLLVFRQNNLPGWRVFVDDQETDIYLANSTFMSVIVPPGEHKVSFIYDPVRVMLSNIF